VVEIEVNNKKFIANKGDTILQALNLHGIRVPVLCKMKEFSPTGACRMCVVEVEGRPNLVPSCAFPVAEGMKIKTHSPRVIKARKTIVELLLANHPDDCLYCDRNGYCELQHYAEELNIRERKFSGRKNQYKLDHSSPSIIRDPAKCLLCGRCVRVCEEIAGINSIDFINRGNRMFVGTALNKVLNFSSCVNCGQCVLVCPTGALCEKTNFEEVQETLHDTSLHSVVQFAPSISVSLAEEFGLKPGKDNSGIVVAALRKMGFSKVFDSSFGADVTIVEEAEELMQRLNGNGPLPMYSSCCPAWVKHVEQAHPGLIPHLTSCKSPQQISGALIKSWYAKEMAIDASQIYSVAIMPCTAKKFEALREEMMNKGIADVDATLTTRELARLIRLNGIDFKNLEPENADYPFASRSSAGKLLAASGGIAEAVIRTLYARILNKEMDDYKITELRGNKGLRKFRIEIGKHKVGVSVVSGLANAERYIGDVLRGKEDVQYIEVMACPGGCINGGGQPSCGDEKAIRARANGIYEIDENERLRVAHKNPAVSQIYERFLNYPLSPQSLKLLHTTYSKRDVLL
jgi:iron-only hydrogenase group A